MKKHTLLLACAMRILLNLIALLQGGGRVFRTATLSRFAVLLLQGGVLGEIYPSASLAPSPRGNSFFH